MLVLRVEWSDSAIIMHFFWLLLPLSSKILPVLMFFFFFRLLPVNLDPLILFVTVRKASKIWKGIHTCFYSNAVF